MNSLIRRGLSTSVLALALVSALALAGCGKADEQQERREILDSLSLPDSVEAAAAYIMIAHSECTEPVPGITRTREEARDIADALMPSLLHRGSDFAEIARLNSDDRGTGSRGGYFGIFRRGEVKAELSLPVFSLRPGEISGVIEGARGFLIVKRLPVMRVAGHHILISWQGAEGAAVGLSRTREQAEMLAEEVRRKAVDGENPCDLARQFSDDSLTRFECGFLGIVEPFVLPPVIDEALFHLRPGKFSPITESVYGFHLVWRE